MKEVFSIPIPIKVTPKIEDEIDRIVDEAIVDTCPYRQRTGRLQDSISWDIDGNELVLSQDDALCDYFFYCDEKTGFIDDLEDAITSGINALTPTTDTDTGIKWSFTKMINDILSKFREV